MLSLLVGWGGFLSIHSLATDIVWQPIGDTSSPISSIFRLWQAVEVDVFQKNSDAKFKVWTHGGLDMEPHQLEGWNRRLCGNPLIMWHKTCKFYAPEYSYWAPFGQTMLGIQMDNEHSDARYDVAWTLTPVYDNVAMVVCLCAIALFWIAPRVSHSRTFHISAATLMCGVGALALVAFILLRMMPTKKAVILASATGFVGVIINFFKGFSFLLFPGWELALVSLFLVGGLLGFMLSYKYRLDDTSQDLLCILLRLFASIVMLSSTYAFFPTLALIPILAHLSRDQVVEPAAQDKPKRGLHHQHQHQHQQHSDDDKSDEDGEDRRWGSGSGHGGSGGSSSGSGSGGRFNGTNGYGSNGYASHGGAPPPYRGRKAHTAVLAKRVGEEQASNFYCKGAPEYISTNDYEAEMVDTTTRELAALRQMLANGEGDWVNKVSVEARRAISNDLHRHKMVDSLDNMRESGGGRGADSDEGSAYEWR